MVLISAAISVVNCLQSALQLIPAHSPGNFIILNNTIIFLGGERGGRSTPVVFALLSFFSLLLSPSRATRCFSRDFTSRALHMPDCRSVATFHSDAIKKRKEIIVTRLSRYGSRTLDLGLWIQSRLRHEKTYPDICTSAKYPLSACLPPCRRDCNLIPEMMFLSRPARKKPALK